MSKRSWIFILFAYGVAWGLWGSQIASDAGWPIPLLLIQLGMVASWAPLFARLIVESNGNWKSRIVRLWIDLIAEPKKLKWLGLAILLGMTPPLLAQVLTNQMTDQAFQWGYPPLAWGIVWISILFVGGGFEEFGWRGWLYPELRKRWNPFVVGIFIGVIHALWHLPLHFLEGTVQAAIPFWEFFLLTATSGWIYAWIMMRSKGVYAVILYHTFANFGAALGTYWQVPEGRWIVFGLQSVLILALFVHSRKRWLQISDD